MSEASHERGSNFSKESIKNVFTLAKEIKPLVENKGDNARQQTSEFLEKVCPGSGYTKFEQILDGRNNSSFSESKQKELDQAAKNVGAALLIAGGDKIFDWVIKGELDSHVAEGMERLSEVVSNNLFVKDENDETGREIVRNLIELEKINKKAAIAPATFGKRRVEETERVIEVLFDKLDEVNPDSDDAGKLAMVIGYLDEGLVVVDERINEAAEKMEEVAGRQGEIVEKQGETVEQFKFNMEELYRNSVEGEVLKEIEGTETEKSLRENTKNKELQEIIALLKGKKQIENSDSGRERLPKGGIEEIYRWMEFIEDGVASVDDLSRNASKYRVLYAIQKGELNEQLKKLEYKGKVLSDDDVKEFCDEVGARMFLHSFYLASSKCKSIEDILRTVSSMHEGEMENDWDRFLVSSFLETRGGRNGIGLRELPVQKAWDLRQKGYFNIEQIFAEMLGEKPMVKINDDKKERCERVPDNFSNFSNGFAQFLKDNNKKLFDEIVKKDSNEKEKDYKKGLMKLLEVNIEIAKTEAYGVPEDIYNNFFQMQKAGGLKMEVTKEYMIWRLMEDGKYKREDAERAYSLAQKLSVATFSDSKVNLNFAADDYAELILFKYVRISNGPGGKPDNIKKGKSKPIGAGETIKHVDTLTCHWMDLSRKFEKNKKGKDIIEWRPVYSPLYSKDIDFSKMSGKGNMPYHFFGVVNSQVLGVQEGFYDKVSPKDILSLNYLPKIFAKINKTTYDMFKAGIMPVYYSDEKERVRVYKQGEDDEIQARMAEKMRKTWLVNLFYMASQPEVGWTIENLDLFKKILVKNRQLFNEKGVQIDSFIPKKDIDHALTMTDARMKIYRNTVSGKFRKQFSE